MTRVAIEPFSARKVGINKPMIVAEGLDGRQWILKQTFRRDDHRIHPTIKKIDAASSINPELWRLNTGRRY